MQEVQSRIIYSKPFSTRHLACVAISQLHVEEVLKSPAPNRFDALGQGYVALIAAETDDGDEGHTGAGLSFLVPRVFSVLEIGWHAVVVGVQGIYCK